MADEIIDGLWVGDLDDVIEPEVYKKEFERVINVLNLIEPNDDGYVDEKILNALADIINVALDSGERVLVHCGAGIERSPLTVVYYLWKYKQYTLMDAYKLIERKRPIVQNRGCWLRVDVQYSMETVRENDNKTKKMPRL